VPGGGPPEGAGRRRDPVVTRVSASPWREGLLALGVLGLVLVLTHAVGLPVANLLEAHVVAPLAGAATRALSGAPVWMRGLVADGVVRGVGTVLTLLPMLGVLFAAAGLLEQTGWLSRVTLAAQRLTGRLGLSGAVAIPLCFGFACNVPAVVSLRSVPSPRDRCAAMLLAPFVPCSARLAAVVLLAPMFFPRSAPLVVCGLVSLNVLLFTLGAWWALAGTATSSGTIDGDRQPPCLRRPVVRRTAADLMRSLGSFVRSAGPIVLVLSSLIGVLGAVPGGGIERSVLAQVGRELEPVARVVGLDDWRLIVALISSAVTKETGVAVLGVLYGAGADGSRLRETITAAVSPASALSFLAIQILFVPCVPTLWAIARESGNWWWSIASAALMLVVSLAAGAVVFQAGRFL
jgi:ferrous iron transport protein B